MYPKPKPEDEAIKKLKQLGLEPANKRCFDCGQRGPTYINVTIGSFVCSACGGLLRGITPPQRIKSVSMASFSSVEIQLIEQRGNEVCANIWLGKWNKADRPTFDQNTDNGRRDFLGDKYEKKLWYVDPSQAAPKTGYSEAGKSLKQIASKQSPSPISVARSRGSSITSLKTPPQVKGPPITVGGMVRSVSLPSQSLQEHQPSPQLLQKQVSPPRFPQNPTPQNVNQPQLLHQQPQHQQLQNQQQQQLQYQQNPPPLPPKASDNGFRSESLISSSPASTLQNFANFDAFGLSSSSVTASVQSVTTSFPVPETILVQPVSLNHLVPVLVPGVSIQSSNQQIIPETGQNDRYAALADLDSTLRSLSFNPDINTSLENPNKVENQPTQPVSQTSNNPFVTGSWGSTTVAQQGHGGVSMVNTSSIMSTGQSQGTPSQFSNFPPTDFPAANSVGQPFGGQNQNQFNMQANHLNNTSQQQAQFVSQLNPFQPQQLFVSQPNQFVTQQPFTSQPNILAAQQQFVQEPSQFAMQQQYVTQHNQFAAQQQFASHASQFIPQQQFVTQSNQFNSQQQVVTQRFATQMMSAQVAPNPTNPFS